MGRSLHDEGSTHVLEAIVITTIMLSAIAFVATYEQPLTSEGNARSGLTQAAQDALAILADTPVDSRFGEDALSAYIAECLNERCDNLTSKLSRLAPEGAAYALYVSNGYDTYPVYVMGEPAGEAVAAAKSFEPQWSSTFVSTATSMVGVGDALLTYALPIFHSNVVTPGGSHLVLKVNGQRSDGSDYVMIGSYSTTAQSAADPSARAVSLVFVDAAGNPMAAHNLTGGIAVPHELLLRVAESQGGEVPAGAEVAVEMPRGWIAAADATANDGWSILSNASERNGSAVGSTIRATLNASLSSGYKDLKITVTYLGDALDHYPIHARLSRGAFASASILLRGETHTNPPTLATPTLVMSVPSPMGRGVATNWTLAAYIPVNKTTAAKNLSGEVEITSIEIAEQEGNPIFGPVRTLTGPTGTWVNGLDSLAWYGSVNLSYGSVLNLTFQVNASGTAGPSESRAAFVPPITFDEFTGKLVQRAGWGFHRETILPKTAQYGGFNTTTTGEGDFSRSHDVSTSGVYRSTPLPGNATYRTAVVGSVEEALYGSYVIAQDRTVPVGGEVVIDANVQSILFALAEAGQEAGVTLRFYPPWSANERIPIFEQENLDQGLLSGEVTQLVVLDVNGDGHADPIVGTTNGRVIAYHGLTGRRIQGNSFTAPVTSAGQTQLVSKITAMETITLYGEPYIVVTTDKYSDGVFVLSKSLSVVWRFSILNADTLAIDTRTDFDGDGQPEIAVARTVERFTSKDTLVYVLKAVQGDPILQPIVPNTAVAEDADAFYLGPGTPTTLLSSARAGPFGDLPGLAVPIQTSADPGIRLTANTLPPVYQSGALSTPRAGVQGLNKYGETTSTLFGAPASVLRGYDYGGDTVDDVILGGTSGYVVMANGTVLTQPLYSYLLTGATTIVSADTRSASESYVLTDQGMVLMTDDGWLTNWGPDTLAVGGKAISSNAPNSFWVVGAANAMYKSVTEVEAPNPSRAQMPLMTELVPAPPTATKGGLPFSFALALHDFRDVHFRGNDGWVVGTKCVGVCATEPIVMRTTDNGTTWTILASTDFEPTEAPTADLNRIRFSADGTGWILGDAGTLLRKRVSDTLWDAIPTGTTYDLKDLACKPGDSNSCLVVGEAGAAFAISSAAGATPSLENLTGRWGLPGDRELFNVGYQSADRAYIGAHNMVLMRVASANWTTLPLNYVENDARAVNGLGDGSGYIYGGNASNGRIWSLHDYHIQSQAQTVNLADLAGIPVGATITDVQLMGSNVSLGLQTVVVNVSTNGDNWKSMGPVIAGDVPLVDDPRNAIAPWVEWTSGSGRDLRFRVVMNTSGDKTIMSPYVRSMTFRVNWTGATGSPATVTLDFASSTWKDASKTTADWNTSLKALRQPLVQEYWTRNVSGSVLDIRTGFDVTGDSRHDVWAATGDTLAENSPDHIIYAGSNISRIVGEDSRVYLLDGATGNTSAYTYNLSGHVRAIRLANNDSNTVPEMLYAMAYNATLGESRLYAFHPTTLIEQWNVTIADEAATEIELSTLVGGHTSIFLGTEQPATVNGQVGHLWQTNSTSRQATWRIIPDDMGKYVVKADVKPGWLFGAYVVEVEVEWTEPVTHEGVPTEVIRSARFYDHFTVTPPDLLSSPTPVYTARLLMWMRDWG